MQQPIVHKEASRHVAISFLFALLLLSGKITTKERKECFAVVNWPALSLT